MPLCCARSMLSHSDAVELCNPKELTNRLKSQIATDALDAMTYNSYCETRMFNGEEKYRLTGRGEAIAVTYNEILADLASGRMNSHETTLDDTTSKSPTDGTTTSDDVTQPPVPPAVKIDDGVAEGTIVLFRLQDIRYHPQLAKIPMMGPHERTQFDEDVRVRRITEPVTLQVGGVLLDGRHRTEAETKAGETEAGRGVVIAARIVNLTEEEQIDQIYRAALLRRSLTDDQRAVLAAEWAKEKAARSRTERARKAGKAGRRWRQSRR